MIRLITFALVLMLVSVTPIRAEDNIRSESTPVAKFQMQNFKENIDMEEQIRAWLKSEGLSDDKVEIAIQNYRDAKNKGVLQTLGVNFFNLDCATGVGADIYALVTAGSVQATFLATSGFPPGIGPTQTGVCSGPGPVPCGVNHGTGGEPGRSIDGHQLVTGGAGVYVWGQCR